MLSYVVRHGLAAEALSYEVKAAVVESMRLLDRSMDNDMFRLTVVVLGHHHAARGLATTEEVARHPRHPRRPRSSMHCC